MTISMEHDDPTWQFEGFRSPNFTTVPDELFDDLIPRLSGAEVKVLLYIVRRTFGFKKERDNISISQMLEGIVKKNGERLDLGAGLSKPTLCRALASLAEKKIIIATRQFDYNGGYLATCYQLNMGGTKPTQEATQEAIATSNESTGAGEEAVVTDEPATLGKKMRQGGLSQNLPKGMSQNLTKPLVKKRDIQETVIKKQITKNVNVASAAKNSTNPLHLLPDIRSEQEHIHLIADDILVALGDQQSTRFYQLVARKIPESVIRKALSELKQGRVVNQAKVFTSEMMRYAKTKVETDLDSRASTLRESRQMLVARLTYE
jgi:hypothetical protein